MNEFNTIVALLGGLILTLGLVSKPTGKSPVPPSLIALLLGICVGPQLLNLINIEEMGDRTTILERAARLTLGIGLVGVALRVPREFPRTNWRGMLVLLAAGMPLMWAISTALVFYVLGISLWLALLIGAILTPTDPIAASPIVTGELAEKNIPDRLRHIIAFESGANDGVAYLFVFLPFLFLTRPADEALSHWFTHTLLWEVGAATMLGLSLGYAAAKLLRACEARQMIREDWRLVYTVALGLLAAGAGKLIASDEVLVIFAAGAVFTQVISSEDRKNEEQGQEAVNRFFAIPIVVLLGAALPWAGWAELGWRGVLLVVAILLFRRIPVLLMLRPLLPELRSQRDALFVGWFGPIAVAAIYYASLMEHRLQEPLVWHVVSLVICGSIVAHGMTGAPLTRLYGRGERKMNSSTAGAPG
ncbi:MAG TPA: cation:proton antiporter [Sphingomicrobium sp.]|nr:cation:proton antiporter [Sphingomicrobium sp.]